ncbi:MAG TPA: nucleoside phosphorylase [Spirochaetales bacterium]|nr:nucleoside phosphorylase [Spirochaetales bacterium]HRY56079.1 nucleoside phosphorylase [Spirochaetia bacterium]HRZ66101.1 nucleoside phosphorylase [Spirochaetia bacterium]
MPVPLDSSKYESSPFFNPADFVGYIAGLGRLGPAPVPEAVILSYQASLFEHASSAHASSPAEGYFGKWLRYLDGSDGRVAIAGHFGVGAPAAAVMLEELIAFGARRFVSVGTAGSLRLDLPPGSLVVCDSAFRDEGTSYHYLPGGAPVYPSEELTAALRAALAKRGLEHRVGPSWTTDAIYRETAEEVVKFRDEGALVVEMEASALFAVARFRGVRIASCFSVSDTLAELAWRPEFHAETTEEGLELLFAAAVEALGADQPTQ